MRLALERFESTLLVKIPLQCASWKRFRSLPAEAPEKRKMERKGPRGSQRRLRNLMGDAMLPSVERSARHAHGF